VPTTVIDEVVLIRLTRSKFGVDPCLVAEALWAQTRPVRSVAEPPNQIESTAPPTATLDPTSVPEVAQRPPKSQNEANCSGWRKDHFRQIDANRRFGRRDGSPKTDTRLV
jgi:hypothetical protein